MNFDSIKNWFLSLGAEYGVDPIIFGAIYIGAIPFFYASATWFVFNLKKKKPVTLPILAACLCAISSYVYLIIVGNNVPVWVYVLIVLLISFAIYSTYNKLKKKGIEEPKSQI